MKSQIRSVASLCVREQDLDNIDEIGILGGRNITYLHNKN